MEYIIKIVKSLEDSGLLIDGATKTVKHKNQDGGFLVAMVALMVASRVGPNASSLIQPADSSLINAIAGKCVMRGGKVHEGEFLLLLALPLKMEVLGKGVKKA